MDKHRVTVLFTYGGVCCAKISKDFKNPLIFMCFYVKNIFTNEILLGELFFPPSPLDLPVVSAKGQILAKRQTSSLPQTALSY